MLYRESTNAIKRRVGPIRIIPSLKGRIRFLRPFLAINCQATIIASLRDVVSPHRPRKRGSAPGCHAVFSTRRLLTRYTPRDEPAATCSSGVDAPTTG